MFNKFASSTLAACAVALMINPAAAATAFTNTDVTLHSGPGVKFMTTGDVSGNAKVGVLWCGGADFAWCLIQFHNKQGWVSLSDLTGFGTGGSKLGVVGSGGHAAGVAAVAADEAARVGESLPAAQRGPSSPGATDIGSSGVHAVGSGL